MVASPFLCGARSATTVRANQHRKLTDAVVIVAVSAVSAAAYFIVTGLGDDGLPSRTADDSCRCRGGVECRAPLSSGCHCLYREVSAIAD